MANVIQLTDNYVATSSVYDTNQNKTQADINSSVSSSITTINSNFSALSSSVSNLNTYGLKIGNGIAARPIYIVGTSTQTKIYIKVTSNYSEAHVGGLLVMEQNGPALLAVLTPSGWSTVLNGNGWKCSYSAPQWTITAGSWTGGFFIPFSNYTFSVSYA